MPVRTGYTVTGNDQIIWEDPPPLAASGGGVGHWTRTLAPLVEHPGRWARVYTTTRRSAGTTARHLRHGRYHIPPGRWEFTSRKLSEDQGGVYARYLGPEEPPA
jgi:hypothetical protein